MYPFESIRPIVDYDEVGTELEDIEPRGASISSPRGDCNNNAVDGPIARTGVTAVPSNDGDVTDCYQSNGQGGIVVT